MEKLFCLRSIKGYREGDGSGLARAGCRVIACARSTDELRELISGMLVQVTNTSLLTWRIWDRYRSLLRRLEILTSL